MLNRREMQYRVEKAREQGVYITNYGVIIAHVMGILPRAIKPFPAASMVLDILKTKTIVYNVKREFIVLFRVLKSLFPISENRLSIWPKKR